MNDDIYILTILNEICRDQSRAKIARYASDPVSFVRDCFTWPEGQGATEYQVQILTALLEYRKIAVRACHGAAKTATAAFICLWFAITREVAGREWKVIMTAGAWRQLDQYLLPEIRKWLGRLKWDTLGLEPFGANELLMRSLRLRHGSAIAVASDNPALIEGAHADSILYIFDESKSISAATFDAAEGAFSGGPGTEAFALACSTPGEPEGRFYEIHTRRPGLEDWHPIHVTVERAMAAGRVNQEWVRLRGKQWGESSALYANKVLGEFHSSDEDAMIRLSWLEAAVERWHANADPPGSVDRIAVDVARFGEDRTCLALRSGQRIQELRFAAKEDTVSTAGRVYGIWSVNPSATIVVDAVGVGAGVVDQLKERNLPVESFEGGNATEWRDRSGELRFLNVRAAAWWHLRDLLDPAHGSTVELPDDPELLGDLAAPHYAQRDSGNRIQLESKDQIRKRLGRSPDAGDAVVMAFWARRRRRGGWHMVAAGRLR